jgi:inner membrane protein
MENEKQENLLDKIGISFHRKLSFKLVTIGLLVLILLIPKMMILSLIFERSSNADSTITEVMSKWSNEQVITGPILTIPYKKSIYNKKDEAYKEVIETATFLPKTLVITGQINPEKLYRSIYDVVVYQSELNLEGTFEFPDFTSLDIIPENVIWEQAKIQLAISDLRGINEEVKLNWSGEEIIFSPGLKKSTIGNSGISVSIPEMNKNIPQSFELSLGLKGSKNILFTPVGEKTEVQISSSWNDPGFTGNFLPKEREITADGFKANWTVLHFNRNFPQQWIDNNFDSKVHNSDFGVELVTVANHYQKNTRSAKYAILIIIITFVIFFMYEVFSKQRIHSFQYIMVGSAITLFYLLLLSISEHLGFNLAYLVAASSVTILVVLYSRSFMPKVKSSAGVGAALAACFGFIFILLQLESYALLAGSLGLFILLSILMFFTRKVNWYNE